ncbi:hypothetical protein EHO58_06255 [Leptospira selangorensis]|uniref:hypothetical protein n=1 Tax=Leptospira selangorensis TaxID=2484982 RepID=UPI0010823689|nr:hypothetical protein [Leptospira selangorensis]TGK08199.1 hypothetical protein EHO58_06255 [Leptospira selangorensis]
MKRKIRNIFLAISLSICISCESDPGPSALEGLTFILAFINTIGNYVPPSVCVDPNQTVPLSVNSPVTFSGGSLEFSPYYIYDPGSNPLNYEFTLSADYPSCAVRLVIFSCTSPNNALLEASNATVSCDSGSYSTHVSNGTQSCSIPSFANNKVILFMNKYGSSFPNPCDTVTFKTVP